MKLRQILKKDSSKSKFKVTINNNKETRRDVATPQHDDRHNYKERQVSKKTECDVWSGSNCNILQINTPVNDLSVLCLSDDLATKANIIIDPAEIQATSMDDLDEDEESGAAQVDVLCVYMSKHLY